MPSSPESFTRTEIKAGVFVLLSGAIFIVFIAAILNYRPISNTNTFYTYTADTGGLAVSSDVRFGGTTVGRISSIDVDPDDQSRLRLTLEVSRGTPINSECTAYVSQVTLTSEKHLEITTGTKDAYLLESGAEIPSATGGLFGDVAGLVGTVTQLLEDVSVLLGVTDGAGGPVFAVDEGRTLADLFVTVDGMLEDLRILLGVVDEQGRMQSAEDRKTVSELLVSLDDTVIHGGDLIESAQVVLDENRAGIQDVLTTVNDVGETAKDLIEDVDSMIAENRDDIDGAIDDARATLRNLDTLMAELETLTVSLNEVLDANSAELEDTLRDLSDTMRNLKEVTRTLADQPAALVRGKQPVGRQ